MPTYGITLGELSEPAALITTPSLSFAVAPEFSSPARLIPLWEGGDPLTVPVNGSISGTILQSGYPVGAGVSVMVYWRATGILIARSATDIYSSFSIPGLDPTPPATPDDGKYFFVALDPVGGVLYNAIVLDRVVPL